MDISTGDLFSDIASKINLKFTKLERNGDVLVVDSQISDVNALVDEGGHGFEPSLYIFGDNSDSVSRIGISDGSTAGA